MGGVPVETGLGRWLTAHAGILLTTVTGVKRGAQDWLGVDASRADLLRPELYGTYHHISVLGDDRVEGRRRYAVGDRIPEPREPFGQRLLPECRRGARLVIHDVGAYGASMGYSYGLTPHCAEYLYRRTARFAASAARSGRTSCSPRSTKTRTLQRQQKRRQGKQKANAHQKGDDSLHRGGNAAEFSLTAARRGLLGQIGGQIDHGIHEHALLSCYFLPGSSVSAARTLSMLLSYRTRCPINRTLEDFYAGI